MKSCYPVRFPQDHNSVGYRLTEHKQICVPSEIKIASRKPNFCNIYPFSNQLLFPVLHLFFNKELNTYSDQKINFLLNYPSVKTTLLW